MVIKTRIRAVAVGMEGSRYEILKEEESTGSNTHWVCKLRGDWGDPWVLGVADWVDHNTTFPHTKGRKRLGRQRINSL